MEANTLFVCRTCWPRVPAVERRAIASMHLNRQDTTTKLAKIVRILKAANP
jgi:hypothetical protein